MEYEEIEVLVDEDAAGVNDAVDKEIIRNIKEERLDEEFLEEHKPESGADTADNTTSIKDEIEEDEMEFLIYEDAAGVNDAVDKEIIRNIKEERLDEEFLEEHKPESGADTADNTTSIKDEIEEDEMEFLIYEDAAGVNDAVDKEIIRNIKEERLDEEFLEEHKPESGADTADNTTSIKDEIEEDEMEFLIYEDAAGVNDAVDKEIIRNIKEERLDEEFLEEHKPESGADTADNTTSIKDEMEYEEIEVLVDEDAAGVNDAVDKDSSQQTDQSKQVTSRRKQPRRHNPDDEEAPKRKWPKKLPKSERGKTKQYSEDDFRKCLEEVRNNVLRICEASAMYNIPHQTISAKIRAQSNGEEKVDVNREKMFQLIKEIKTILTFTNATPYKSKHIRYYCAYCSTDGPHFEDPDDLRTHTRTEHVDHRTEKIEYAMRPYWMNEVIKLDIENLLCTVCCVVINNWNEMFKHLKDKHNIHLDQAYTRVIPYELRNNLQCALCKESFSNYLHLDGHMNAHYNNYVCDDCGDTFLARARLNQHVQIHNTGKFSCRFCEKIFTLQKYRRQHEETVHEQRTKFKCQYCTERFAGEYLRHLHCLAAHPETVKTITCEFCGDCFTWKQYYTTHIRKKHQNRPYECSKCNKKFCWNYELKEHMLRHVGTKNFECPICHKKYKSMNYLKQHVKLHKKKNEA